MELYLQGGSGSDESDTAGINTHDRAIRNGTRRQKLREVLIETNCSLIQPLKKMNGINSEIYRVRLKHQQHRIYHISERESSMSGETKFLVY